MDYASLFAKMVHTYLPKWCILIYRIGALLVTENGALLFTDHNGIHHSVSYLFFYRYVIPTGLEMVTLNPF